MKRKWKRLSRLWSIQIIPHGKGNIQQYTFHTFMSLIVLFLLSLLIVAALTATFYIWIQAHQTQQTNEQLVHYKEEYEQLTTQYDELQQKLTVLYEEVDVLEESVYDIAALEEELEELETNIQQLSPEAEIVTSPEELTSYQQEQNDKDSSGLTASTEEKSTPSVHETNEASYAHVDLFASHIQQEVNHLQHIIDAETEKWVELKESAEEKYEKVQYVPSIPPTTGRISSPFGWRVHPIHGDRRMHEGIDFANSLDTPIYATAHGIVTFVGRNGGHGKYIEIDHGNGYKTTYSHLNGYEVDEGDEVQMGDKIGRMGTTGSSTGVHLHYEVHQNGEPVDPAPYLKGEIGT